MHKRTVSRLVLAAALSVVALPLTGAQANHHCDSDVWFLTGAGLVYTPHSIGCDVIAEDFPETEDIDESNTNFILPGATSGIVRWSNPLEPTNGALVDGAVQGSRLEFDGNTIPLRFTRGTDVTGAPLGLWDSQTISIGRTQSILGGEAVITVCFAQIPCEVNTYRTVGTV